MTDRPKTRDYARIERERRFLLNELPSHVDPNEFERLFDSYLEGTQIRLRVIENPLGETTQVKLGQKLVNPDDPENPSHRKMTTLYLDVGEKHVFADLPARKSVKRRYRVAEQGWTFMIDVYEGPESAAGIIICEVECETDEQLNSIEKPSWAVREITSEPKWSGAVQAK